MGNVKHTFVTSSILHKLVCENNKNNDNTWIKTLFWKMKVSGSQHQQFSIVNKYNYEHIVKQMLLNKRTHKLIQNKVILKGARTRTHVPTLHIKPVWNINTVSYTTKCAQSNINHNILLNIYCMYNFSYKEVILSVIFWCYNSGIQTESMW